MQDTTSVSKFLRSELSFYATLMIGVISVAGFYFAISNRIDLLTQELKFRTEGDTVIYKDINVLKADFTDHE